MRPAPLPLAAAFLLACALTGQAAPAHTAAEVAAARQEILDKMLTEDYQPALIANGRRLCAAGGAPANVIESRAGGAYFTPDAADDCITTLVRTARDGNLPALYRELLTASGGEVAAYERWPRIFGNAVLGGATSVPIGNRKVIAATPALAFDAGFTVAYQDGGAAKAATVDRSQLKAAAESCLGQHQDAATCFSVGYTVGAQAFTARTASAR